MSQVKIVTFNGERYVWAKDLHTALDLVPNQYSRNLNRWLSAKYLFVSGNNYKEPTHRYDYFKESDLNGAISDKPSNHISGFLNKYNYAAIMESKAKSRGNFAENCLIRLELAKLIAVNSNSRLKDQLIQWLLKIEAEIEGNQRLTRPQILGLMEMVKMCSLIDNQIAYYRQHKDRFFEGKEPEDDWREFDNWRNKLLSLMTDAELNEQIIKIKNIKPKAKWTKVEKLALMDSLESIRASLFDFLTQRFSPYTYNNILKARDLADFVKTIFETAGIQQIDIKAKGYSPDAAQLDLFRVRENIDIALISKTIRELTI